MPFRVRLPGDPSPGCAAAEYPDQTVTYDQWQANSGLARKRRRSDLPRSQRDWNRSLGFYGLDPEAFTDTELSEPEQRRLRVLCALFDELYPAALATLTVKQREAWLLSVEMNKSTVDIGTIMGTSQPNAWKHLKKARDRIAAALENISSGDAAWKLAEEVFESMRRGIEPEKLAEQYHVSVATIGLLADEYAGEFVPTDGL